MEDTVLTKAIRAADEAWYDAGGILGYFDIEAQKPRDEHEHGMDDTLALFIVREMCAVYGEEGDDESNITEIGNAMIKAMQDLEGVNAAVQKLAGTILP